MRAYFDASVVATLLLHDRDWEQTYSWIASNVTAPHFSDFTWGEFVSAVGRRVRMQESDIETGLRTLARGELYLQRWSKVSIIPPDVELASQLVTEFLLGLRLPDAIHLALARRFGLTLVTSDRKQANAAKAFGIACIDPTRLV